MNYPDQNHEATKTQSSPDPPVWPDHERVMSLQTEAVGS